MDRTDGATSQPSENGTAASTPGHPPAGTRPPHVSEEAWVEAEKNRANADLLKAVLDSPNTGKAIDALFAAKSGSAKHSGETRERIAAIQAKHAFRSSIFFLIALTICLGFLASVIYALRGDKDTLLPVLSAVISLIAGTGGGYVFGRQSVTGRAD